MLAPVCSSLADDFAAAPAQVDHQRVAGRPQRGVHFVGAGGDGVGHLAAGLGKVVGELLRAVRHVLDGDGGFLRKALRDLIEPGAHHLLQARGELGEFVVHVLGLETEAGREVLAGGSDGGAGAVAGGLQPVEQSGAALGQRVDHGIADMAERKRDVLALFGKRAGDALGDFADFVGDQIADRGDVVRQIEMDAGDGVAHVLGLADQGLALIGEPVEKIADAHFVVVVGALDRGDFVVHQRFQFGRARQRALDPVAHGGDFAADGLSDRHDLLARGVLRLGQPHRHLGDGLGDQAQVVRAAEHVREHIEEDHRHDDGAGEPDHGGNADPRGREQGLQLAGVKIGGGEAAGGPDEGAGAGEDIGHARRAVVQGLQYPPELGAVVIGGAARRRVVGQSGGSMNRSAAGGAGIWLRLLSLAGAAVAALRRSP